MTFDFCLNETNKQVLTRGLKLYLEFRFRNSSNIKITINMAKRQKMSPLQLEDLPDEMILKVKNFTEPEMFSFTGCPEGVHVSI